MSIWRHVGHSTDLGNDCSCKFSHSFEEYMNQKDEDIGDVCPVFEAIGRCPDGFRCRWLGAHVRKSESGKAGTVDGWELVVDEEVMKVSIVLLISRKLQRFLTRN